MNGFRLSEKDAVVLIYPDNDGPMARVGKAPVLESGRIEIEVNPLEPGVQVFKVDATIFSVYLSTTENGFSQSEIEKINSVVREQILKCDRYPEIRYTGQFQAPVDERERIHIAGEVEVIGVKRSLDFVLNPHGSGLYRGRFSILQTDFGIQPVSSFFGALRSRDLVEVEVKVKIPNLLEKK